MFGFGAKRRARQAAGPLSTVEVPPTAGVLSGRIVDGEQRDEPVRHAEFTLSDSLGRTVIEGGLDPYGSFVATVPAGEYRFAVSADGRRPFRSSVAVDEGGHTDLGDLPLDSVQPPTLPAPGDWDVEPAHSSIAFTARHIGLARVHGRFNVFAGAVRIAERMEESALHVVIDAASIDTNVPARDEHLRSPDFLDAARFPTLEFYGDRFAHRGGSHWAVTGALSLHGVTRTVTLETEYLGLGHGMEGETRAACRAVTELHRDDFTVSWQTMLAKGIAVVGPSITIELDIQIVPKAVG
ncbi:YceI family protein [Streptomyces albidoflavus]|uniref:YceI family protein n=1 Tax=Streptomyces albidoflavus TaxID=1886 RepID=UPI0033342464